ncbi:DUF317 domain-containing protein [Streptomyces sp. LBUM 1476]|nr:DUF317 domain-containing protein [Streptomyces sp. LBUM 1476]MBZ3915270.1 DUF317 domain-containing protein [Streptomyces acidiscabies]
MVSGHDVSTVFDLLATHGWSVVSTPEANLHATSPDRNIYVGWLPEDPDARSRDVVFRVHVTAEDGTTWTQAFGIDTPPAAVACFLLPFLPGRERTTS